MWISGSMIMYYYIHCLKEFFDDHSKNLTFMVKLPIISSLIVVGDLVYWYISGTSLFLANEPVRMYKNLFMDHIGGMSPGGLVKFLGLLGLIPIIYSSVYFLGLIRRSPEKNVMLTLGIILSIVIITNDLVISVLDPVYGVPMMFICNFFEIIRVTSHNQLEFARKISVMNQQLIQKSRLAEAGNYYSTLSHEIMNSLQAARGYLEFFRKGQGGLTDQGNRYLDIVERQIGRIEKLAKNVKKTTRESFKLIPESVSLKSIYQHSLETVQLMIEKNNVRLAFPPDNSGIKVFVVEDELIQVFNNLITNAIEAMGPEGDKWIEIRENISACGNYVIISIRDSGDGVPPSIRDKIWEERFTTKENSGLGLGLHLCREIIQKQNGTIYLSPDSANTEFTIKLPIAR